MKKRKSLVGMLAMVLALSLVLVGCPPDDTTPGQPTIFKVIVTSVSGGTIEASPSADISAGDEVTLTITAEENYIFLPGNLVVTGNTGAINTNGTGGTYRFTMPASDVTVTGEFEEIPENATKYEITIESLPNGTITATPSTNVAKGVSVTLSIEPDSTYHLKPGSLSIKDAEGDDVDFAFVSINKYTFTMPESNVTVTAEFSDYYTVDLETLPEVKNSAPFTIEYDDFLIKFPEFFKEIDFTSFSRITINCKYFDSGNTEISQRNSHAMVVLIYDADGDIRGPTDVPGPNTPLKEFHLGGAWGRVSKEAGADLSLDKAPEAILFQNANLYVKYIEVTEIKFHNSTDPILDPLPIDELEDIERWHSWVAEAPNTTITHFVNDDNVAMITVGGSPADQGWKATGSYRYTAEKDAIYEYKFKAWTESGERDIRMQYYEDNAASRWWGEEINLTTTPTEFTIISREAIPENDDPEKYSQSMRFHGGLQTGTFFVEIISIKKIGLEYTFSELVSYIYGEDMPDDNLTLDELSKFLTDDAMDYTELCAANNVILYKDKYLQEEYSGNDTVNKDTPVFIPREPDYL